MAGAGGGRDASQCQRCSSPVQGGERTVPHTLNNTLYSDLLTLTPPCCVWIILGIWTVLGSSYALT